jgi:hypothetical protein
VTTVLFLTHPQKECGVHQFGKLIFSALAPSKTYAIKYCEVASASDIDAAIVQASPAAVIVNWHPLTMAWAQPWLFWDSSIPVIGVLQDPTEEVGALTDDVQFDYYIVHDPSANFSNPVLFKSARPIPPFQESVAPPSRLTIGTYGFATPGRGFEGLVARANAEFDDCVIRINIPNCHFGDPDGAEARRVADRCRTLITKPNVELRITHDFLTMTEIMTFLAGNSLNAFFCEPAGSGGISGIVDLAIAAGRPIALREAPMFRHMSDASPSIFVEQRSLSEILADGAKTIAKFKEQWSLDRVRGDYEAALDQLLRDWRSASPDRIRSQWSKRLTLAHGVASEDAARIQAALSLTEERASAAEASLAQTQARLSVVEAFAVQAEARAHEQASRAQEVMTQLEHTKRRKKRLKSSFSWRVTTPLRWIGKTSRSLFRSR